MKVITEGTFADLVARADASPRRRSNFNLHETPEDPIQRLFVAARRDSYFRPHRHPDKWEFSIVLRGEFEVFTFDANGTITQRFRAGPDAPTKAFELPENVFHTYVPLTDEGIFLEVKAGPYDPHTASQFAAWAPEEGAEAAPVFAQKLLTTAIGARVEEW